MRNSATRFTTRPSTRSDAGGRLHPDAGAYAALLVYPQRTDAEARAPASLLPLEPRRTGHLLDRRVDRGARERDRAQSHFGVPAERARVPACPGRGYE